MIVWVLIMLSNKSWNQTGTRRYSRADSDRKERERDSHYNWTKYSETQRQTKGLLAPNA